MSDPSKNAAVMANATKDRPASQRKQELADHFDRLASGRERWKRNRYYHDELARFVSFLVPEGSRVLDIGCGAGDLLAATRPDVGVGVDLSPEMLEVARRRHPGLQFRTGDAEDLPVEGAFE